MAYQGLKERKSFDSRKYSIKPTETKGVAETFIDLCFDAKNHIREKYEKGIEEGDNDLTVNHFTELYGKAVQGDPSARQTFIKHISSYLAERNDVKGIKPPTFYDSLEEAIFEEMYGWGPLSILKKEPYCESVQSIGTNVELKRDGLYTPVEASFRDLEHVKEVYSRIANSFEGNKLDEYENTDLETPTFGNYRCSIMIPNAVEEPVITIRQKVYEYLSFQEQSGLGTIPNDPDVIELFSLLARLKLNGIVAGPPGCGKSTMLLSMMGEFVYSGKVSVFAESNKEFSVNNIFKNARIIHSTNSDLETILARAQLRHDVRRVIAAEIRAQEAGFFGRSSENGIEVVLGTLHENDPYNLPKLLARLYVIYHQKNLDLELETERFNRILDYSIVMDEIEGGSKKVLGVQFYDVAEDGEPTVHKFMEYDLNDKCWYFKQDIPPKISRKLKNSQRYEYNKLESLLNKLENKYSKYYAID